MNEYMYTPESDIEPLRQQGIKSMIWISEDLCLTSKQQFNWWHKKWANILLGWKINDLN